MRRVPRALAAPLLLLAGCGQDGAADREAVERAAEQSPPDAVDILRNAAPDGNAREAPPPTVPADGNGQ